jgi:hypothetical protein
MRVSEAVTTEGNCAFAIRSRNCSTSRWAFARRSAEQRKGGAQVFARRCLGIASQAILDRSDRAGFQMAMRGLNLGKRETPERPSHGSLVGPGSEFKPIRYVFGQRRA